MASDQGKYDDLGLSKLSNDMLQESMSVEDGKFRQAVGQNPEELKLPDWLNPKKIDVKVDIGKIIAEAFDKQVISKLPWYKRWVVRFCLALAQMFLAVCRWFLKV